MATLQSKPALDKPHRAERAIDDARWIQNFLQRAPFGVIAFTDNGQPYLHTNLFVYEKLGIVIYMHTGRNGRMSAAVSAGIPACFTVSEMGRLLPGKSAMSFSVEYASVMTFGKLLKLEDQEEGQHALQLLLDKYSPHLLPGRDYQPIQPDELDKTAVYRLEIESWSGKLNRVVDDFPGAYHYPDWSILKEFKG